MSEPRLHLDEDASKKGLYRALLQKGHDVTRTPNSWMPLNADDEMQLLGATAKGRVIFTHNIADFLKLAQRYPHHGGIILAAQGSWPLPRLITALDRLLKSTQADDWPGRAEWLKK
jgi:hypothetical protein